MLDDESNLPRYYRIKCRIILATTRDDWHAAERDRIRAENIWWAYRRLWPAGQTPELDPSMDELRKSVDDVKAAQDEQRPFQDVEFMCNNEDYVEGEFERDVDQVEGEVELAAELAEGQMERYTEIVEGDMDDVELVERAIDDEIFQAPDVQAVYKHAGSSELQKPKPEESQPKEQQPKEQLKIPELDKRQLRSLRRLPNSLVMREGNARFNKRGGSYLHAKS